MGPSTRYFATGCGSPCTISFWVSVRVASPRNWPQAMKNCWSGVKPSILSLDWPWARLLEGAVGDLQSRQVADRFAQHQLAVDVDIVGRLDRDSRQTASTTQAVLAWNLVRSSGVHQLSSLPSGVELRALVVEAVRDFVPDYHADGSVVHRVGVVHAERRRLQDAGRKDDLVHQRVVVGVRGRRRHAPPSAIHAAFRSVDQSSAIMKRERCHEILEVIVAIDFDRRVILPLVGIADLDLESGELFKRLLLGLRGHPVQAADGVVHGGQDVGDHVFGALLGLGGK